MILIICAGFGAALGSMMRFALLEVAPKWFGEASGLMTLVINLLAAFAAGLIYGLHAPLLDNTFLAAGIIGGFSTFSGPVVDLADNMFTPGQRTPALIRMMVLLLGGLIVFQIGAALMHLMK